MGEQEVFSARPGGLFPEMVQRAVKLVPVLVVVLAGLGHAQLDLPGKKKPEAVPPRGDVAPGPEPEPLDLPGGAVPVASEPAAVPAPAPGSAESASALFEAVARARRPAAVAVEIERLLVLGAAAHPAARVALASSHAPSVLAGGRVLLAGGAGEREAVARRLVQPIAAEVGLALLAELRERDPKLATPAFLAGLLEHPEPALRTAAQRALEERLTAEALPALQPLLASGRATARSAALELVSRIEDPLAWNLLVSRLADPSAQLAGRAATLLGMRAETEPLLREAAFGAASEDGGERRRAYALLGLVQAEESRGRILLGLEDVPALLPRLSDGRPLVAGTAAIALARIGFRSGASEVGPWLAREVPHQLVRCGTGVEFHADFSVLELPALRALALLSGASLGDDGAAWREWWLDQGDGFQPRHAVLELPPDAAAQLRVDGADAQGSWVLLGPGRAQEDARGDVLRLDPAAAGLLLVFLREAGAFDARHLPAPAGPVEPGVLRLQVGTQEKRFMRAAEGEWFDQLAGECARLRAENAWQRHPDGGRTRLEFWQAEAERWSLLAPEQRRRELKRLVLASLRQPAEARTREARMAELEQLYALEGVPEASDVEALLGVLGLEAEFGPRVERALALTRRAIAARGGDASTEVDPLGRLLALTLERFGAAAVPALRPLAHELSPAALELLRADLRPAARALAAEALVHGHGPQDVDAIVALLHDPEELVVRTTLEALAAEPCEPARARLLELARAGSGATRAAALRALVPLRGKDVLDLAQESLGDADPDVQRASAWALAELADPRAATLLASLLTRGPGSPFHADARRGLLRLGDVGVAECLRLARAGGTRAQREGLLLLAELGRAEAVPGLLALLAEAPDDERVLRELSVLSGIDFGREEHPETAGFAWWDLVVHDDSLAWFLAAAERGSVRTPAREELEPVPSREGARFLLEVASGDDPLLAERALRELERVLGQPLGRPEPEERSSFLAGVRAEVARRFPQ